MHVEPVLITANNKEFYDSMFFINAPFYANNSSQDFMILKQRTNLNYYYI